MFFLSQLAWLRYSGTAVLVPSIDRQKIKGEGNQLRYVVMGDSSAIGQGAEYEDSVAMASVEYLSKINTVHFLTTGVSGARVKDVRANQLNQATAYSPDLVVIMIGSNDVTHVTSLDSIRQDLQFIVETLKDVHSSPVIVITGSADMGVVPRIPQPLRLLVGVRTDQVNRVFHEVIESNNVTRANIQKETGTLFKDDPTLFAQDNFHPNAKGYATWSPVVIAAIDSALDQKNND